MSPRAFLVAVAVGLCASTVQAEPAPPRPLLREADVMIHEIDRLAAGLRLKLRHARAVNDPLRALVLNDQVNQADVASRRATEARGRLIEAITARREPSAAMAVTEIGNLRLRTRRLAQTAPDAEVREASGETRVIILVDPRIPQGEPTR